MFTLTVLKQRLTILFDRLHFQSLAAQPRLKAFWLRIGLALVVAGQKFNRDRGFGRATELAYTTLLALVPVTALILMIVTSFTSSADELQQLVFRHLIPSSGSIVSRYIDEFARRAGTISVVSSLMLVVTSVSLLNSVGTAINDIWRVRERRSFLVRLTAYWSLLTLGPILVAGSIYVTAQLRQTPFLSELLGIGMVSRIVSYGLSMVLIWIACFLLYTRLPYTRVNPYAGLVGGVAAGTLWELARFGFDWYVLHVVSFDRVYGSLGVIPVFLLWLYLTWIILLFGAELSFAWQNVPFMKGGRFYPALTGWDRMDTAMRVLAYLARGFVRGEGKMSAETIAQTVHVDMGQIQSIATVLEGAQMIHRVNDPDGDYLLARPPESIGLDEVFTLFDGQPASNLEVIDDVGFYTIRLLSRVRSTLRGSLAGMTVKTLLNELEYRIDFDREVEVVKH